MVNCCIDCRANSRVLGSGEWLFFLDYRADSSVLGSGEWLLFLLIVVQIRV